MKFKKEGKETEEWGEGEKPCNDCSGKKRSTGEKSEKKGERGRVGDDIRLREKTTQDIRERIQEEGSAELGSNDDTGQRIRIRLITRTKTREGKIEKDEEER